MRLTFLHILGYIVALSLPFCIYLALRKHDALSRAEQYTGEVIGHVPHRGSKGRRTYALEIAYRDKENQEHTFETSSSSNPPARSMGEEVLVLHHTDGAKPDVLIFEHLFLGYWIWACFDVCIVGCMAAPWLLDRLYTH